MKYNSGFFVFSKYVLLILTLLVFLTPLWVFKDLLFPFITSKAFYLRILVEMGLPFFVYIVSVAPDARPSFKNPLHISVLAFFLLNIISAFSGVDSHKALWGNFERMGGVFYLGHLILLYFYIVTLAKISQGWLKAIVLSNIWMASFLAVYSILLKLGMPGFVPDPSLPGRVSATFGNPIFLPSYLIPIFFLTLFWSSRKTGWSKLLYIVPAFFQLIAMFLSGTRGAVVGLILGGFITSVVAAILAPKGRLRMWGLGLSAAVFLIGGLLYFNSDKLPEGSMVRRVFQLKDSNTQARLIQWRVALTGFKDHAFFGTGAENYYVTGNKYYNPEIYNYDPSWFDKPHNYWLEVLVTNGIIGFASYAAIIFLSAYGFYRAFRYGAVSLGGFAFLLAGLLVYQIQNLFVFDTVSAAMSFFLFISFGAFLWEKILQPEAVKNKKSKGPNKSLGSMPVAFAYSFAAVSAIATCYSLWAGNFRPLSAAKNVNYGYAYAGVDPKKAQDYFQKSINEPFNFDLSETSSKYQEFALGQLRAANEKNSAFAFEVAQKSIDSLKAEVSRNPLNPILWQKLGMLALNYSYIKNNALDPFAKEAIQKAIDLAPKRTEARSVMVQIELLQGNLPEALRLSREVFELNPKSLDSVWQLSVVEKESGNLDEAIKLSESLIDKKYSFQSVQAVEWLIAYYKDKNDWNKLVYLYTQAAGLDSKNVKWFIGLADAYYNSGDKAKAGQLARQLDAADPSLNSQLEKYLQQ